MRNQEVGVSTIRVLARLDGMKNYLRIGNIIPNPVFVDTQPPLSITFCNVSKFFDTIHTGKVERIDLQNIQRAFKNRSDGAILFR